ncbi:MAG: metallopeptidase family protein [Bryobacter sp.]|jgi:predicted Zn-dependent protease with MMP-like domain|nr:metallopeptidase family protein [Bryobacter sp.]
MTPEAFDKLVESALKEIPARFRARLRNVALVVEAEPPRPGLLGLYEGRPLTERGSFETISYPDRITIYQGPHERMARDRRHLAELVRETVWHEIGHYFGMNERQVLAAQHRLRRAGRFRERPERP